jgi:hypothetical protein
VRFAEESYMLIAVSCLVNISEVYKNKMDPDINFYIAVGFAIVILAGYPLFLILNFVRKSVSLDDVKF